MLELEPLLDPSALPNPYWEDVFSRALALLKASPEFRDLLIQDDGPVRAAEIICEVNLGMIGATLPEADLSQAKAGFESFADQLKGSLQNIEPDGKPQRRRGCARTLGLSTWRGARRGNGGSGLPEGATSKPARCRDGLPTDGLRG